MSQELNLAGLDRRLQQVRDILNLDATPLMLSWMLILDRDNREGILQGLDRFGVPMIPVSYRPKLNPAIRVGNKSGDQKTRNAAHSHAAVRHFTNSENQQIRANNKWREQARKQFRLNQRPNLKKGTFAGLGAFTSGINNNLSTSEYKLLGGPPLAPRDQFSRVITNYETTFGGPQHGAQNWFVQGQWNEVVDMKGRPFLMNHFEGRGVPRRDLRGIRPQGLARAMDAMRNWARTEIRKHFA